MDDISNSVKILNKISNSGKLVQAGRGWRGGPDINQIKWNKRTKYVFHCCYRDLTYLSLGQNQGSELSRYVFIFI